MDIPRAAANFRFYAGAILHEETQSTQVQGTAITWTVNQVTPSVMVVLCADGVVSLWAFAVSFRRGICRCTC